MEYFDFTNFFQLTATAAVLMASQQHQQQQQQQQNQKATKANKDLLEKSVSTAAVECEFSGGADQFSDDDSAVSCFNGISISRKKNFFETISCYLFSNS